MNRFVFITVVAATLALTAVAQSAGGPSGTYRTDVRATTLGGALDGVWTLKFQHGRYVLTDTARVKASVIHGMYSIAGNRITFMDRMGTCSGRRGPSCPVGCPAAGTYRFKLSGNTLGFTEISDSTRKCVARAAVLKGSFVKVG